MRNRSTRRFSVVAASVTAAAVLGLGSATAISASTRSVKPADVVTATCLTNNEFCSNISSLMLNQGNPPNYVSHAVPGATAGTIGGRIVNLNPANSASTTDDFIVGYVGKLGQLCSTGVLPPLSAACSNYDWSFPVHQVHFAPNNNPTGFCIGAPTATTGTPLQLVACGTPKTYLVSDLSFGRTTQPTSRTCPLTYAPLELASDNSPTPLVLQVDANSTDPINALTLQPEMSVEGQVVDRQQFTLTGPVAQAGIC